jgi:hypothetical protein
MRTFSIPPYLGAAVVSAMSHLLVGCSGTTDTPDVPRVAGTYSVTESVNAATCAPNELPSGGTVRLEAFSQTFSAQIDQVGSTLSLRETGQSAPAESGTIDAAGAISLAGTLDFQEAPREGDRMFFVHLTFHDDLHVQSAGRINGTSSYVNVFHEGSSTAPTYTTCSREGTIELLPE